MTCKCASCPECHGSGHVFYSMSGEYHGRYRLDDLDDIESCEGCQGSGISEICDECYEKLGDEE